MTIEPETVAAGPSKIAAVAVIGYCTMLWGGVFAALGVGSVGYGFAQPRGGHDVTPGVVILTGYFLMALSVVPLLAGWAVLKRKGWGRILTFVVAALFILSGLLWLCSFILNGLTGGTMSVIAGLLMGIVSGAPQLAYGILAYVILIKNGAEFSPPRV